MTDPDVTDGEADAQATASRVSEISVESISSTSGPIGVLAMRPELLDEEGLRVVTRRRPLWLSVAIDGHDAFSHDSYRGVIGGFARAIAALDRCRRLSIPTRVITHVRRHNHDAIAEMSLIPRWFAVERWLITFRAPYGIDATSDALTARDRQRVRRNVEAFSIERPRGSVLIDGRAGCLIPATH